MTAALLRLIRAGYHAARLGSTSTANPWPVETYGGHGWALGWRIGTLPPVARAVVAWVVL